MLKTAIFGVVNESTNYTFKQIYKKDLEYISHLPNVEDYLICDNITYKIESKTWDLDCNQVAFVLEVINPPKKEIIEGAGLSIL
jgi:hypothetical protein